MQSRLTLQLGDITAAKVDAIVSSAHENLLEGGPVHSAVHKAAGPGLMEECELLGDCPEGDARISGAHDLPYAFIIHAVPPTWMDGNSGELEMLSDCYRRALDLARTRGAKSLAFPSLGSGTQPQIPLELAAPVAIRTILSYLDEYSMPEKVVLVCFDVPTYQIHQKVLRETLP
jgi:O-acetyl-ADP-ribose deacetylase (regulator of RNase III)